MRDATNPFQDGSEDYEQEADLSPSTDNLPLALTSFVGREREMAEVEKLLVEGRLLTLTGPGGSGKTRLALAVASGLSGRFEDGVWIAELAPLSDPDLVPQAFASVLGVRESPGTPLVATLAEYLEPRVAFTHVEDSRFAYFATAMGMASLFEPLKRRIDAIVDSLFFRQDDTGSKG